MERWRPQSGAALVEEMMICAFCGYGVLGGGGAPYRSGVRFTRVAATCDADGDAVMPPYAYAAIMALVIDPLSMRPAWEAPPGRRHDPAVTWWWACSGCAKAGPGRAANMATLAPLPFAYSAVLHSVPLYEAMLVGLVDVRPQFEAHAKGYVSGRAAGVTLLTAPLVGLQRGSVTPSHAVCWVHGFCFVGCFRALGQFSCIHVCMSSSCLPRSLHLLHAEPEQGGRALIPRRFAPSLPFSF